MSIPKYITPTGMKIADELDLLYGFITSIKGICAKLDADGTVTDEDYESLCYTAICNCFIYDSRGNLAGQKLSTDLENFVIAGPNSIGVKERIAILYQIFNMWETLLEKCDADHTDTNYEALWYTATFLWKVMDHRGNILGNSNYLFKPGGGGDYRALIDLYYAIVASIEGVTAKLDDDTAVADTNYEALWYTANILVKVTNSAGNTKGN